MGLADGGGQGQVDGLEKGLRMLRGVGGWLALVVKRVLDVRFLPDRPKPF